MVRKKTSNLDEYALFKLMADCAPVLLWMSRTDSLCIFFNKTWLNFTGRSLEQEWGVGWTEGVHFEDFQRCMDTYIEHFNKRTPFEMEYRLRRKDNEYRWIFDKGVPYYDTNDNFCGFIGSCTDITETKNAASLLLNLNLQLEEKVEHRTNELKKSQSLLEQEQKKQSEFVATISHELRTPMTAIKSAVEILKHGAKGKVPKAMQPLLEVVQRNSARMLRLIDNILDIEKIEAGKLIFKKEKHELLPLLKQAINANKLYAEKYQVKLKLIKSIAGTMAKVDEDRFIQVLDNLLSNAAKFSGAKTTVTISMKRQAPNILILVKDCGKGIPREFADKIFGRFMQADAQESLPGNVGSGLGLNIAKSIVEEHNGNISFKNSPSGTTFIVSIPEYKES